MRGQRSQAATLQGTPVGQESLIENNLLFALKLYNLLAADLYAGKQAGRRWPSSADVNKQGLIPPAGVVSGG